MLHVNRTWCEFCWEEEPEEWMQISRCVSVHVHFHVTRLHCIIMSFIDQVPKSGAGIDGSSEESLAASPALLPKPRGTSKTILHVNMHVEFASYLVLK